jgi:hypothetical protein
VGAGAGLAEDADIVVHCLALSPATSKSKADNRFSPIFAVTDRGYFETASVTASSNARGQEAH